jgi:MFS family permease
MSSTKQNASHYYLPRMNELGMVFWVHSFTIISASLVAVFVPALLYKLGYSVAMILVVYIAKTLLSVVLQYSALWFGRRFGANRLMALAQVCDVIYYGLLFLLAAYPNLIWVFVVVWAIDRASYWSGFHTNFSISRNHLKEGQEVGGINALVLAIGSIAPIVAGLLVDTYGPSSIYVAAIVSSTVAAIPALFMRGGYEHQFKPAEKLPLGPIKRDLFANGCAGIVAMTDTFIWPLMIFLIVGSFAKLGALMALVTVITIVTTIYIGKHEHAKGDLFLRLGIWITAAGGALRLLVSTGLQAAGVSVLGGLGKAFGQTPYLSRYYRNADRHPRLEYINAMEAANSFGVAIYLLITLGVCVVFGPTAGLLFGVALSIPVTFGMKLLK